MAGMYTLTSKRASAAAAAAVLLAGLATAATTLPAAASATAACTMTVGAITSGGDIANTDVTATAPITAKRTAGVHLFTPGVAKFSATWTTRLTAPSGKSTSGELVLNSALYSAWYGTKADGTPQNGLSNGSKGWQGYHVVQSLGILPPGHALLDGHVRPAERRRAVPLERPVRRPAPATPASPRSRRWR